MTSADASADGPVTLLVLMRAKPGCGDQVQEEITAQLRSIQSDEEACTYIAGSRHSEDPLRFLIYEEWRSRAEFDDFYQRRESMRAYLARMQALVAEGELTFWEQAA